MSERHTRDSEYQDAKSAAVRLLSYRARTRGDLQQRLRGKGLAAEAVEEALDDLERVGYIDDEDYARERLDGLLRKSKKGHMALMHALIKDGLDRDLAERIVAERLSGEDLGQWALEVAADRVERLRDVEPETARRRLYGYLKRRGFTDAQTLTAVDEAMAPLHDQD